jgi:hypothetical protein
LNSIRLKLWLGSKVFRLEVLTIVGTTIGTTPNNKSSLKIELELEPRMLNLNRLNSPGK